MDRRSFMRTSLAGALVLVPPFAAARAAVREAGSATDDAAPLPPMTVYKSASCGCCKNWIEHARGNGFTVKSIDTEDLVAVKRELGVPASLQSCHTVVVGNYLVEGHVPAADVKKMLTEKPAIRGLAVPGMPIGSPGMEQGPVSGYQRYDVMAFTAQGKTSVFAKH